MAKVCAIVLNTISRDARVLKEAESLQLAGHDVTLLGLTDCTNTTKIEKLTNGVNLRRLDMAAMKKAASLFVHALVTTCLLVPVAALYFVPANYVLGPIILATTIITSALIVNQIGRARRLIKIALDFGECPDDNLNKNITLKSFLSFTKYLSNGIANKLSGVGRILALYWIVRRLRPDVLHCHDIHTLPIGILAKWTLPCFVVYDAHEIYEEVAQGTSSRARSFRRIHSIGQRYVDAFITINDSIAAWYAEHYPALPKAVVIKNATKFAGSVEYDGRLHVAAGLSPQRKILLYQGGFSTKRGLEYLIESARYLNPDWALVMMGWGSFEPRLREIARYINQYHTDQGNPEIVVFIPPAPQNDLALWTAGGTVGIIPYEKVGLNHWFCTPNKLWEYPNAGLPMLVSPFPELSRPVLEHGHGWLLPEDQEPRKLAELINSLGHEQIQTAKNCCENFMKADSWDIYSERLVSLYEELLRSDQHELAKFPV